MTDNKKNILLLNYDDESFFDQLFDQYYRTLCIFALRYVRQADIAEDLVQDVFLKLWTKREKIKTELSLKSYLYMSVKNRCLDHLKHQKIKKEFINEPAMFITDTDQKILEAETKEKLYAAINKLPEKCRETFKMSRFHNMKYKEIAKARNISEKTVENQIGKALKILRENMKPYL